MHKISEVQARPSQVTNRLGYPSLSDHQQKAVVEFVGSRDVSVVLRSGSRKSVCFAPYHGCSTPYEVLVRYCYILAYASHMFFAHSGI